LASVDLASAALAVIASVGFAATVHSLEPIKADSPATRAQSPNQHVNQPRHAKSGAQEPPPQTVDSSTDLSTPQRTWNDFFNVDFASFSKQITGIVPNWVRQLPDYIAKLNTDLSGDPHSLRDEIWEEANDPECNPEIIWDATVRVSEDLCTDEKTFLARRKHHTLSALSDYLGIPAAHIHPDDVPVIAMCGSGGGLRALVAGSGSYIAAREAGLFDCVTYTAGVSGSCWLQTIYFTRGHQSHKSIIHHLKSRLGTHLANPDGFFPLFTSAPTNKFLLTGHVEQMNGMPDAEFNLVNYFGMLLASRLLVPKGELGVDLDDLKISNQQKHLARGEHPMPIYTAVRHEIPDEDNNQMDVLSPDSAPTPTMPGSGFQWFEFTPYEFWCEEASAGIPTWALGRKFDAGKTVWRENGLSLPEMRTPLLLGIWGSAFCATLWHYWREIRAVLKGITIFASVDKLVADKVSDLATIHPINPASVPNFAYGMQDLLPSTCPSSLIESTHLKLMDAGMSNNLPIYPLLRPGREVDVVIAFDASADVKTDNWLKVVDGYARQRNIRGWPIGAGWPPADESPQDAGKDLERAQAHSEQEAKKNLELAQKHEEDAHRPPASKGKELGYCNVWVGSTSEHTASQSRAVSQLVEHDSELRKPDAGIAVIYYPFVANPKTPGVDPKTSDYLSTWNFIYTPEQIDSVVSLARANFEEGKDQTRRTIRAVYERKKALRIEKEKREKEIKRASKLRSGLVRGRKLGEGDHGDHFS